LCAALPAAGIVLGLWRCGGGKRREDERRCGGVIGVAHKVVWEKGEVITDTGYLFKLIAGLE
jgi:hypothetical protein